MTFDNRAHRTDYTKWYKCARCKTFTLFNDNPSKTTIAGIGALCPDCWEKWKDLPQYRVTKKIQAPKDDWPIEYMLLYGLVCSLTLLIIAYYIFWK